MVVRKVGKYEVGRTIGEGTFAKVKFAQNTETGESVAMKVLDRSTIIKHKMVDQVGFWFLCSVLIVVCWWTFKFLGIGYLDSEKHVWLSLLLFMFLHFFCFFVEFEIGREGLGQRCYGEKVELNEEEVTDDLILFGLSLISLYSIVEDWNLLFIFEVLINLWNMLVQKMSQHET